MRRILILILCGVIWMGCKAPVFTVVQKRETPRPYRKVLALCVDGEYDFSLPDSSLINICVHNYFEDSLYEERMKEASLLSEKLSSSNTQVVAISAFFGPQDYSYKGLKALIDSGSIDGIFIYDLLQHTQVNLIKPSPGFPGTAGHPGASYSSGGPTYGIGFPSYSVKDGAFRCYLLDARSNLLVWMGQSALKGRVIKGRQALTAGAADQISRQLAAGMYIIQ